MLSKPKEKTIDAYLKLVVKPVILCACEFCSDSMKKENICK